MIRFILLFIAGAALLNLGIVIGLQFQPSVQPGAAAPERTSLHQLAYRSGPFQIDVAVQPQTPKVGKNMLTVRLQDSVGEPVRNAEIKAIAEMPAMGSMAAMQAPVGIQEIKPGLYRGAFELPMEGSWPLTLEITANVGQSRLTFDMATGRLGLQFVSGAVAKGQNGMQAMQAEMTPPGTIMVDSRRRQLIGVKTGEVAYRELTRTIRAVGQVTYDETQLADVTLKFDAWIGDLYVNYVGAPVKKGKPLFTVYGPELLAAQQEYLEINRRAGSATAKGLLTAARKRLSLWDMTAGEIAALARRGVPDDYVPIHAPRSGTVVTKNVVEGTARQAGETLMRIADLSQVWIEAEVYEGEVPLVKKGMPSMVRFPYLPSKVFKAKVDYIYPYLEDITRTGRIRLSLPNPNGVFKPGMYAQVNLKVDLGKRLVVPEGAVLFAGNDRVVFEDLGGGHLAPRKIETGQRNEDYIEVLKGLQPGDKVVTSGNFLIASEARLKTGIEQW
jgi:Cu(I)/Ag(I) efflux system membrane fusion protein